MCRNEFRCKSLNFRLKDKSCDLNDGDKYTHPEDYGPQEGSVYMDTSLKHKKVWGYLTIILVALSGHGPIAHEAKPNGLLARGP